MYLKSRWMLLLVLLLIGPALASAQFVTGRYIVELSGAPAAEAVAKRKTARTAIAAEVSSQRAAVRAQQKALRARIEQAQATVVDSVDTVANALIVRATANQAARIAGLPGVARVHQVRRFKLHLDAAIPLHQVDLAWNQIGQDRAGLGVKIAVIDTGIDAAHPGFQDSSLPAVDGFPKVNDSADLAYTNNKVIVARSYPQLWVYGDPDPSARDHVGHGTALGMCAAGVTNQAPFATITGVAPKAYLGSYKIFGTPGYNDSATDDAILKALDDAVADGMDVISLSFGTVYASRLQDDLEVQAIERATALGVIVTASAGNDGPDPFTMSSPATAPSALAVGASHNARFLGYSVTVGPTNYPAIPGTGPAPSAEIVASLADVASLDGDGMACSPLAAGSLSGRVALILRGVCYFQDKLNNAAAAGAVAAIIYTDAARPDAVTMAVGNAVLPAEMVSNADGVAIQQQLQAAGDEPLQATLRFDIHAIPVDPYRVADFSSRGPNVDGSIKPDLLAAGTDIYTATQSFDPYGEMFDSSGYIYVNGTSFSAPLVAGSAALLKAARPGYSASQYRSMLVNTAVPLGANDPGAIQQSGAGLLNVNAALNTTATVSPTALSFGVANRNANLSQTLTISNLGTQDGTFVATVIPRQGNTAAPTAAAGALVVAAGSTADLAVQFPADDLAPGSYEGVLALQDQNTGATLRIPYWYAIPAAPYSMSIFQAPSAARAGSTLQEAILFRVLDASGVPLTEITPTVTISGAGSILAVNLREDILPGLFAVDLTLDPRVGVDIVTISAGDLSSQVVILGR